MRSCSILTDHPVWSEKAPPVLICTLSLPGLPPFRGARRLPAVLPVTLPEEEVFRFPIVGVFLSMATAGFVTAGCFRRSVPPMSAVFSLFWPDFFRLRPDVAFAFDLEI